MQPNWCLDTRLQVKVHSNTPIVLHWDRKGAWDMLYHATQTIQPGHAAQLTFIQLSYYKQTVHYYCCNTLGTPHPLIAQQQTTCSVCYNKWVGCYSTQLRLMSTESTVHFGS